MTTHIQERLGRCGSAAAWRDAVALADDDCRLTPPTLTCQVVGASAELLVGTATVSQALDQARHRVSPLDGVVPHAAYGRPAAQLAVFGDNLELLVVGSRGHGPVGRLVHGSTSLKLANMAHCPFLVLPRSADRTEPAVTPYGRFTRSAPAAH